MNTFENRIFHHSRVRPVTQTEMAECGLACIAMVAGYHGLQIDLAVLRRKYPPSVRGVSLKSLITICDDMGMISRPVKVPLEHIGNLELPAILHWDLNHFVVVDKITRDRALIHNPDGKSRWLHISEISEHFTGVALEIEPSLTFERGEIRQKLRFRELWSQIRGLPQAIAQIFLLSLILQIFVIISPYYLRLAIDNVLPASDRSLLNLIAFAFACVTVFNGVTFLLRSFVLLSVGSSFGYGLSSNLARRLFRLPIDWFEKRHVGDILSRFQSVMPIRTIFVENAPAVIIDGLLAITTLVVMALYSVSLAAIAFAAFILCMLPRLLMFDTQMRSQERVISSGGKEQTTLIESLQGMRTLRLSGREVYRYGVWRNKLSENINENVKLQRLIIWQSTISSLILALENVITIWIGFNYVMSGFLSVGMLVAFLAYKVQFAVAGSSFIDKSIAFKMLSLHLGRISDIALADEDVSFIEANGSRRDFTGQLELRDICFRYSPSDPIILDKVSLTVEAGEFVAITGPSGGGKSTLLEIMLGLIKPTSGEILIDGLPLHVFGHRNFQRQIAAVLQDDTLFGGPIADNISMFGEATDTDAIVNAAEAAAIAGDIRAMPMGYETFVGDMGSALSGGQRQRILLARALYRKPRLLVMDEGTAHLDHACEQRVNESIQALGVTRVIVAHREETIRCADRILVLENGSLRAEGQ